MVAIRQLALIAAMALGVAALPADQASKIQTLTNPTFTQASASLVPGERCGPTVCDKGQVCCNSSCGICTPPGGVCIQLYCETVSQN
ncbi:hypothetical protein ACRALDRAFT_1060710 [Sodiomyces alcalophilus JCM 7366]|uniref:uncharacterized protein n=1 Tax=Sodiomyces alcalophilus JCM 7366 TaxID=591952 RepID=UPI0039B60E19